MVSGWCPGGWSALVAVMAGYDDPAFYGDRWAEVYYERHAGLDPAAVEVLAGLSGGRRVLALAIRTGRGALPPARRGIPGPGAVASAAAVGPPPGRAGRPQRP